MTSDTQLARQAATWARKAQVALASRDAAIRDLHTAGWTLRAIAELVGLSHAGVSRIINRTSG